MYDRSIIVLGRWAKNVLARNCAIDIVNNVATPPQFLAPIETLLSLLPGSYAGEKFTALYVYMRDNETRICASLK
jgi:hypothetical protein